MLPSSAARVPLHTPEHLNERIRSKTQESIAYYAEHPHEIDQRLYELDAEWDIERLLEANAASLAATGSLLALFVDRRWAIVPAIVTGFLLQHAVQGWCPPVSLFRRLGFRTPQEIEAERYALKALRGDFDEARQGPQRAFESTGRMTGPNGRH